ncbi:endonuclease III [Candidatus Micrarchaeota archaeon]|nr:endonuclease III [Candidatus Micrarchaeota archaeon]
MEQIQILKRLKKLFGNASAYSGTERTPFRVLVGTVLSARTRDITTAIAARKLFAKYGSPSKLAKAPIKTIRKLIKPVGFYRTKARNIKKLAGQLLKETRGKVPETIDALIKLPGVGRKTASCVLNYAFRKPAIAVDAHVHRVSNRLGLVRTKTPEQTEHGLKRIYPKREWRNINNLFVLFGQNLCLPIKPKCEICVLNELCPSRLAAPRLTIHARFEESRKVFLKRRG